MSSRQKTSTTSPRSVAGRFAVAITLATALLAGGVWAAGSDSDLANALDAAASTIGLETEIAAAAGTGCTSATRGPVCIQVFGDGTRVREIVASRFAHGGICRSSVWMYAVYPGGWVRGLSYQTRNNCSYGAAYFLKRYGHHRYSGEWLPHGTRVCVKWMESGSPVGGEPCLTIRR